MLLLVHRAAAAIPPCSEATKVLQDWAFDGSAEAKAKVLQDRAFDGSAEAKSPGSLDLLRDRQYTVISKRCDFTGKKSG